MSSDKCNSITGKRYRLDFSLLDVASGAIPQYIHDVYRGLTFVLLCVSFIFADSAMCQLAVAHANGFLLFVMEIVCIFVVTGEVLLACVLVVPYSS